MAKRVVVDTSAVLAMLLVEPGGDRMAAVVGQALIGSVNVAEVVAKLIDKGQTLAQARRTLEIVQLDVEPFDEALALASSALRPVTRALGLSLGDRACVALAQRHSLPVLTADKAWLKLEVGVEIELIR
jgi:ribonuclease VapC